MQLHTGVTPARLAGAIAALLAALFVVNPAIGQFKSAHEAVDFQNLQRINAAFQNYVHDNDDTFPVFFQNIVDGVCLPNAPQICGYRSMWQFHIAPYLESWSAMRSPSDPPSGDPVYEAFNVSYGYNYAYLSTLCAARDSYSQTRLGCGLFDPGNPGANVFFESVKVSAVHRPATTIEIADGGGRDLPRPSTLGSIMNPPDAWPSEKKTFYPNARGWGINCDNYFHKNSSGGTSPYTGRWGDTDGFAPRYGGGANTIFVDGHSAWESSARGASGTNWAPNRPCDNDWLLVTDYSKYEWDPRYDEGTQRHF
ncbi:MAG: hypothetical protein JSS66_04310 [Armatimonadetes bacterium]|nr:hypothetical protein [Armatimonadota bacterium]